MEKNPILQHSNTPVLRFLAGYAAAFIRLTNLAPIYIGHQWFGALINNHFATSIGVVTSAQIRHLFLQFFDFSILPDDVQSKFFDFFK